MVKYYAPLIYSVLIVNLITDWYHWWWQGRKIQKTSDWKNKPPWPGRNYLTQCWCGDVCCFYDFILCMQIKESKISKYIPKIIYCFGNISLHTTCFHFTEEGLEIRLQTFLDLSSLLSFLMYPPSFEMSKLKQAKIEQVNVVYEY